MGFLLAQKQMQKLLEPWVRPELKAAKSSLCRGTLGTMPPLLPSLQGDTGQGVILNDPFALAATPGPQVRPQEGTAPRKAEPHGLSEARRRCPPRRAALARRCRVLARRAQGKGGDFFLLLALFLV